MAGQTVRAINRVDDYDTFVVEKSQIDDADNRQKALFVDHAIQYDNLVVPFTRFASVVTRDHETHYEQLTMYANFCLLRAYVVHR